MLSFVIFGCNNSKDSGELKYSPFIGEYKILMLQSNIPMDLNRDGISTADFRAELSNFFDLYDQFKNPTLIVNKGVDIYTNVFYDYIPKQDVNPTDINDIVYYNAGPLKTIKFNNSFSGVTNIDGFYDYNFYKQQKWAIIKDITVLINNDLLITFEQQYFTIETGWKTCILKSTFTKIK